MNGTIDTASESILNLVNQYQEVNGDLTSMAAGCSKPDIPKCLDIGGNIDGLMGIVKNAENELSNKMNEVTQALNSVIETLKNNDEVNLMDFFSEEKTENLLQSLKATDGMPNTKKDIDYESLKIEYQLLIALGMIDNVDRATNLLDEMDIYLAENHDSNFNSLKLWLSKIPDNFSEYADTCKWDSVPFNGYQVEGAINRSQWFKVNDTNFRITSVVDVNNNYPDLSLLMNESYCYNLVNEMKSWPDNYLDILAKRDYLDVVVTDYTLPYGAARYNPSTPYSDYIVLPTVMSGNSLYSNDYIYNYLNNTLPHEMSHYLDRICGITISEEVGMPNSAYNLITQLLNANILAIERINHNGILSPDDENYFNNYKVGGVNSTTGDVDSFIEGMAELMRADLVDHDAFLKLIGQENYDLLYNNLSQCYYTDDENRNYTVAIGEKNDVTIYVDDGNSIHVKKNDEEIYKYDDNKNVVGAIRTIYDDDAIGKLYYDSGGNVVKATETRYDGELITSSVILEYGSGGNVVKATETIYDGDCSMLREYDSEGILVKTIDSYGNDYVEEKQYDSDGKIVNQTETRYDAEGKTSSVITREFDDKGRESKAICSYGNERTEWQNEYDSDGKCKTTVIYYKNGLKISEKSY